MQTIIEDFLASERLMRDTDLGTLMGWSEDTLKAKLARRETPRALRIKRLVLFRYSDVAEWIATSGAVIEPSDVQNGPAAAALAADALTN